MSAARRVAWCTHMRMDSEIRVQYRTKGPGHAHARDEKAALDVERGDARGHAKAMTRGEDQGHDQCPRLDRSSQSFEWNHEAEAGAALVSACTAFAVDVRALSGEEVKEKGAEGASGAALAGS